MLGRFGKIAAVIIFILITVGIIWQIRKHFQSARSGSKVVNGQATRSINQKQLFVQSQIANQAFISSTQKVYATDKDFDGLSDADEINVYHTDPNNPDTDRDGLLDGDEVKIYKTNPLKFDTYGIGHSDGWGVRQGIILPGGKVNLEVLKRLKITATNLPKQ